MRAVLAALVVLTTLGAGEPTPLPLARRIRTVLLRSEGPVPTWERDLEVVLRKEVSFTWEDTPLEEAIEDLRQATGANFVIDVGVAQADLPPITLRATNMLLGTSLKWIARICKVKPVLADGAIVIGPFAGKKGQDDLGRSGELRVHLLGPVREGLAWTDRGGERHLPTARQLEALVRFARPELDVDGTDLRADEATPWGEAALVLAGDRSRQGRLLVLLDHLAAGALPAEPDPPWLDGVIGRLDGCRLGVEWVDEDLMDCVAFLQREGDLPIILDPEVVAACTIPPITLRLKDATPRQVLNHLCRRGRLGWQLVDEAVYIAARPVMADPVSRVYDLAATPAAPGMASLVELITRCCRPEVWEHGSELLAVGPRLFVRTTPDVHRDLARLLSTFTAEPTP